MCGDGANDCGALKAAHVGISLSEAESSVASPFTSKQQNISCVPKVIKEGRAALVTSFGVFKIMVCYSLVELGSVIILYNIDANLSSPEFLFIDLCLILNFASIFGLTKAYSVLCTTPPSSSLMSLVPVASIICFLSIATSFQVFANFWIQTYEWFTPFVYQENVNSFLCYENYIVFCVSMFQYITMAVVFSKGKPYREPLYTNRLLMLSLIGTTIICLYLTLFPHEFVSTVMELKVPPMEGRIAAVVISLICFICCFFAEEVLVDLCLERLILRKFKISKRSMNISSENASWEMELPILNTNVNYVAEHVKNGKINNGFIGSTEILS